MIQGYITEGIHVQLVNTKYVSLISLLFELMLKTNCICPKKNIGFTYKMPDSLSLSIMKDE